MLFCETGKMELVVKVVFLVFQHVKMTEYFTWRCLDDEKMFVESGSF
jgi:hypothetical protein